MRTAIIALLMSLLLAGGALASGAADHFVPLPARGGGRTALMVDVERYSGGVNGLMIVELRNTGTRPEAFDPEGLYFIPQTPPALAPQREGAVGPLVVRQDGRWIPVETVSLRAGETKRVGLQVFCIDSQRPAPDRSEKFRVASERLPVELWRQIEGGADIMVRQSNGDFERARSSIQTIVWQIRDADYIVLEGERPSDRPNNLRNDGPSQESGTW